MNARERAERGRGREDAGPQVAQAVALLAAGLAMRPLFLLGQGVRWTTRMWRSPQGRAMQVVAAVLACGAVAVIVLGATLRWGENGPASATSWRRPPRPWAGSRTATATSWSSSPASTGAPPPLTSFRRCWSMRCWSRGPRLLRASWGRPHGPAPGGGEGGRGHGARTPPDAAAGRIDDHAAACARGAPAPAGGPARRAPSSCVTRSSTGWSREPWACP